MGRLPRRREVQSAVSEVESSARDALLDHRLNHEIVHLPPVGLIPRRVEQFCELLQKAKIE
ncbi:Unknown protein sequence [Pseudomonas syringae pv. maculicola]|nr:Unknown protein sequence [Pseudomonas syringae pv. maculicola]